jgi:UDP-arabinose 4-epimerase
MSNLSDGFQCQTLWQGTQVPESRIVCDFSAQTVSNFLATETLPQVADTAIEAPQRNLGSGNAQKVNQGDRVTEAVLVIGGAGYVGSHVAKAVAASGRLPVVVDNLSGGHRSSVQWGPLEVCDVRDTAQLSAIIAQHKPNAVMHFAASIEVGIGEREPLAFFDNNVAGTISVLKAMQANAITQLVFSSTCAIYGNASPPLLETTPKNPASVYGRTKAIVEGIIEDCVRAHGLNAVALRYFNACGADVDGTIGEMHDPETHLIPNVLKAACGLGAALNVFGTDYPTPDGTCLRDYIHVTDLAQGHVQALDLMAQTGGFHAFNLGTGKPLSVLDIIAAVERATGKTVPYELAPRRAGDVAVLTADISRAREALGFAPRHSDVDNIVRTAWAFHQKAWNIV